jgi:hypothetical protein
MHTFQLTNTSPTHRRLSDSALGILRELPAGTATTRPVDPADFEVIPQPKPDATALQVKVWLGRNGISEDAVVAIIEASYPAGPQRLEALARWKSAIRIPFNHPMVPQIAAQLSVGGETITPEAVWEEILAVV